MPTSVTRIFAPQKQAEDIAAIASELLPLDELSVAVSETKPDDPLWRVDIYAGPNTPPEDLEAEVRRILGERIAGLDVVSQTIEDADWVAQSLAGLDPVEAGRFLVHGAHDADRVPDGAISIQVEAALAFGTGHHGTTRGCLLAFDELIAETTPQRVLDLGTGTGVLAIAAAKALGIPVLASDIDTTSVAIAQANVDINGVADRVAAIEADGFAHPDIAARTPFDLIFANILAGPLIGLAPDIARATSPGGHVILSGLMAEQADDVRAAYLAEDFRVVRENRLDNWVTMTLRR